MKLFDERIARDEADLANKIRLMRINPICRASTTRKARIKNVLR